MAGKLRPLGHESPRRSRGTWCLLPRATAASAGRRAVSTSSEVGGLYSRRGQQPPVTGLTGLWYFPGIFILVGPIIWFVKTNGALNAYWRSVGAP